MGSETEQAIGKSQGTLFLALAYIIVTSSGLRHLPSINMC